MADLISLLRAGQVRRFHTAIGMKGQSVAEHTFGVCMIVYHISDDPSTLPVHLVDALYHDLAEYWSADIPAPVKWENPEFKKAFTEIEERIFKEHLNRAPSNADIIRWADMLEGLWYTGMLIQNGNEAARRVYNAWCDALYKEPLGYAAEKLFIDIKEEVNRYDSNRPS